MVQQSQIKDNRGQKTYNITNSAKTIQPLTDP